MERLLMRRLRKGFDLRVGRLVISNVCEGFLRLVILF